VPGAGDDLGRVVATATPAPKGDSAEDLAAYCRSHLQRWRSRRPAPGGSGGRGPVPAAGHLGGQWADDSHREMGKPILQQPPTAAAMGAHLIIDPAAVAANTRLFAGQARGPVIT
jgi:hypothetical protein